MSVISFFPDGKRKDTKKESLESVYSSGSRLTLLNKRARISAPEAIMSGAGDRRVTQRVLSANAHRLKRLQNQLADAHYHMQELTNENRILKALQKKQEIALQRYENSNAELPLILNSHSEEIRVQQAKYKQMKQQLKETSQKLKEKDAQHQQLKDEHQHLMELSKDRNLPEREKLHAQVVELTAKVQQQNETISMLQRRIALETKNFKHHLQVEINKHKDTRHDLDLAITNADKLSTIIEIKEKLLSTAASRTIKSPTKSTSAENIPRNTNKVLNRPEYGYIRTSEEKQEEIALAKLCENSRGLSSALSNDEDFLSSTTEPRSKLVRSRLSSVTRSSSNNTRKNSKDSDNIIELAKTVQDGMAELAIFDEEKLLRNQSPEVVQKKIETMKNELMNKIKNNEDVNSRKSSAIRRYSTEESIEEQDECETERLKLRGRRSSSLSFYEDISIEETHTTVTVNGYKNPNETEKIKSKKDGSNLKINQSPKPIDKYCKDIIHDIERSSKVIDKHMKEFTSSKFESDKLVQQLEAVDKINEFVNSQGDIPSETLTELNNNFKKLTDQVTSEVPIPRKRSLSGRNNSRNESKSNLFGDSNMSNQELLEDLLGKK